MQDLREFLEQTDKLGELRVIEGASWESEIGALTYLAAEGASPPALLFDKVPGYKAGYRVLTIPHTTDKRMNLTFGLPPELTRLQLVTELKNKLSRPFEPIPPVEVKDGPVMENIDTGDDVDVFKFPTPQWQPRDGGRYIGTGDNIIMRDPDEGWVNVGAYRVELHDKKTATIFMEPGRHGVMIRDKYWARGQSCPVAVTCGGPLLTFIMAALRMPYGTSEYDYLGWWEGKPLEVVKGPTTGLPIPAATEIVLEGEIVPPEVETRIEGPFSEWTGHYSPARPEAALRVKCVMHRNDPIILGELPFLGPGVYCYPVQALRSASAWNELNRLVPGVKGVWMHLEFSSHGACAISIEQKYGGHAKQTGVIALGALGYIQKLVIIVDDDVDPTNLREVLFAVGMRSAPESYDIIRNFWGAKLDPLLSPEKRQKGDFTCSSAIIEACKPFYWIKDFPPMFKPDPGVREQVRQKWGNLLS